MPMPSISNSGNGNLLTLQNQDVLSNRTAPSTIQRKYSNEKPKKPVNTYIIPIVFLEIIILTSLTILACFMRFSKYFNTYEQQISCCDFSIFYNKTDESSANFIITIGKNAMYCVNFLIPPGVIAITELLIMYFTDIIQKKTISTAYGYMKIPLGVRRICRYTFTFILGAIIVSIWTDGMKYLTGRPRPYFFKACQPEICQKGCSEFFSIQDCLNNVTSEDVLSFPSYYSALSSFAAVYIIIYLHTILSFHGSYSIRPTLAFGLGAWPLLTGYSKWMSNENHWTDVLFGYIIGISVAVYLCMAMLNSFMENIPKRPPVVPGLPPPVNHLFSHYSIPRIPLKSDGAGTMYQHESEHDTTSSVFEPNSASHRDNRNVEDYRKRNYSPYAPT